MTQPSPAVAATRHLVPSGPAAAPRLARIAAHLRAGSLDRALIAGADPAASRSLAARAQLLGSRKTRRTLADALELLVRRAGAPRTLRAPLVNRRAVLAHADELCSLAQRLRGPEALYVRGIAVVSELLTDGTGPLHRPGATAESARALELAHRALAGHS